MKAIRTRYSGPTNTRPSKITATDSDGNRVTVSYSTAEDWGDPHEYVAYLLMQKMGWSNELFGGGFGHDQYWTMRPRESGEPPFYITYFQRLERCANHGRDYNPACPACKYIMFWQEVAK